MERQMNKGSLGRYFLQNLQLPKEVKTFLINKKVEPLCFCFIDLDEQLTVVNNWLVVSSTELLFFENDEIAKRVLLSDIKVVDVVEGLSLHKLNIHLKNDSLITFRYSHKQKQTVSQVQYLIEQAVKGQSVASVEKDSEQIYLESIYEPIKKIQGTKALTEMDVFMRLIRLLAPYKKLVVSGVSAAIMLTLVGLIPAYLTGYILDHVIKPFSEGAITQEAAYQFFYYAIGGLVVTYSLRQVFSWVRLKNMSIMGEFVARDLREQLYTHLHKLSLGYFSTKPTGSLISRVSSDTDRIWDFIAFGILEVITSIIMLMGLSAVLISLDWKLGLLVSLPVPFVIYSIVVHGRKMRSLFLVCWRRWSKITDLVSDTLPGMRVVKAFNKGDAEVSRFKGRNNAALETFNDLHLVWTKFWPKLMLSINAIVIGVWVFGVPRVFDGIATGNPTQLTTGEFVSFIIYLTMFVQPIEVIGQVSRMMNRATSSAHRVFEVLDTEPQMPKVENPEHIGRIKGSIEFNNVTFSYDGVRNVLKNVSFKVKPGEMIGLVGPSGGGKTTITNLIARFYDTQKGQILVDGIDVKNVDMNDLRGQLGMVLQDPYLFNGSVYENIKYGCETATHEQVIEASKAANAHEFIMRFSYGYDTVVGERGHTLSGGERQRVSIARAILRNPRVLILDEATSAVDTETERKIQEALDRLVKGRTVLAIAHRLSTLAKADRLIVVKHGEVVEQGTHQELLGESKGVYKNLVDMQQQVASVQM